VNQINAQGTAVLDARPEDVYATIADYRQGHPQILPRRNLYDLQVEQGGYGAGTTIHFTSRLLGVEQSFHQQVSEPEPGTVLVEEDIASPRHEVTTFTVRPVEQGRKAHVTIATTMNASAGFRGLVERALVPIALRRVYREELHLLEVVARKRSAVASRPSR
jgi:Polyketide cyclase / dehydrase and lipid transport